MRPLLKIACGLVFLLPAIALGWDAYVLAVGDPEATFCEALRQLNARSGGLLALLYFFGGLALGIHIFFLPWLPRWWQGTETRIDDEPG